MVEDKKVMASNSFSEEEVLTLAAVLEIVQRGGDASVIAQKKTFGKIRQKVQTMKERVEKLKTEQPDDSQP